MEEIRGGRISDAFGLRELSGFNPFDCNQLIDEFHKLFQHFDKEAKGFLTVDEILDVQTNIARSKDKCE